jgi:Ca2+-binding EF-hand superfamily protein
LKLNSLIASHGEPGLHQRLKDASHSDTGMITQSNFDLFLKEFGMSKEEVFCMNRICGFHGGSSELKVNSVIITLMQKHHSKKGELEEETLKNLAKVFTSNGCTIAMAFEIINTSKTGLLSRHEFKEAMKTFKITVDS